MEENRYARLQKTSGIGCVHKVGIVSSKQGWNQEGNRHTSSVSRHTDPGLTEIGCGERERVKDYKDFKPP